MKVLIESNVALPVVSVIHHVIANPTIADLNIENN